MSANNEAASWAAFFISSGDSMTETEARLNSHEAVCLERYGQINARLKRLETILITSVGALICGMATLIGALLFHGHALL